MIPGPDLTASEDRPPRVDLSLRVETPENVTLVYRLAGPSIRLCAWVVDFGVRLGLGLVMLFSGVLIFSLIGLTGVSIGTWLVTYFLLTWAYYPVSEGFFRGKTFGKHVFRLRVIQQEGYPLTFLSAVLRNLVRTADSLPVGYGVGFLSMLIFGQFRRLGDLAAGSVVIEERVIAVPRQPMILEKIAVLPRGQINSYVPDAACLSLIDQFLGRRQVLTYERGHALAGLLAQALARRLNYQGDPTQVAQYPMGFLARVYVTFHRDKDEEAAEAPPVKTLKRLRPIPAEAVR
jgi:uncharacterized RDD family membrane protein YckC